MSQGWKAIQRLMLAALCWGIIACTIITGSYGRLAAYLHTPEGFKEWQRGEEELRAMVGSPAGQYRRS